MVSYSYVVVRDFPSLHIFSRLHAPTMLRDFLQSQMEGQPKNIVWLGTLRKIVNILGEMGFKRSWSRYRSKCGWLNAIRVLSFYFKSGGFAHLFIHFIFKGYFLRTHCIPSIILALEIP